MAAIRGTVRSLDGGAVEGVLVMGADLNYVETDAQGNFRLARPEMALFFWCTGFAPAVHLVPSGDAHINVVLSGTALAYR